MFSEGFSIISNKLKEMYRMITLGGDAELEFADKLDPFTDGIYFSVSSSHAPTNICPTRTLPSTTIGYIYVNVSLSFSATCLR